MKIGELFVELGIETKGDSLTKLLAFETALKNVAAAAQEAVGSLKGIAALNLPKEIRVVMASAKPAAISAEVAAAREKAQQAKEQAKEASKIARDAEKTAKLEARAAKDRERTASKLAKDAEREALRTQRTEEKTAAKIARDAQIVAAKEEKEAKRQEALAMKAVKEQEREAAKVSKAAAMAARQAEKEDARRLGMGSRPWQTGAWGQRTLAPDFVGASPRERNPYWPSSWYKPQGPSPGTPEFTGPMQPPSPGSYTFMGPVQPTPTTKTPPTLSLAETAPKKGMSELVKFLKQVAGIGSLAVIFKTLISGFTQMIKSSMQASVGLDRFTRQTGMTTEETKKWEQVAAARGVSFDEVKSTLSALRQNAENISMGMGGNTTMMRWGIDPLAASRNPSIIFDAFQKATQGMSESAALAVASQAEIPVKVAQALLRERENPTQIVGGLALTKEQLSANNELNASWGSLKVTMSSLADIITSEIAPALTGLLDFFRALAIFSTKSENRTVMSAGSMLTGSPMGSVMAAVGKMSFDALRSRSITVNAPSNITANGISDPEKAAKMFKESQAKHLESALSDALYSRANPYGILQPTP